MQPWFRLSRTALALLFATRLAAQETTTQQPVVTPPVTPSETDLDLRKLPRSGPWKPGDPVREVPDLLQSEPGRTRRVTAGSLTLIASGSTFAVQSTRGADLAGPVAFESLWREGRCALPSAHTLSVLYDESARRWLLARWASLTPGSAFHYCIAVSRTSDPVAGGWLLYDFALPMYRADVSLEKTANLYSLSIGLGGAQTVFAFDRARMLEGAPAAYTRMPPLQEQSRNR